MASTSKDVPTVIIEENPPDDLEPGACYDSILNPTDSFEEFASGMSSSLQERNISLANVNSTISEIQSEIFRIEVSPLSALYFPLYHYRTTLSYHKRNMNRSCGKWLKRI